MFQQIKKNRKQFFWIVVIVLLLVAVRGFENQLFYDPFLNYYRVEYAHLPLPKFNVFQLFFSYGFRFYINSVLSLFLLYVVFKDTKIVKFSILLYMLLGSVTMIGFFFVLNFFGEESKMTLFYFRRFIIQPLFILLLIPAFYYQKKVKNK